MLPIQRPALALLLSAPPPPIPPTQRSAWSLLGFYFDHAGEADEELIQSLTAGLATLTGRSSHYIPLPPRAFPQHRAPRLVRDSAALSA